MYKYQDKIKFVDVDFAKPWWAIVHQKKLIFGVLLISIGLSNLYDTLMIQWIAQAFENKQMTQLVAIIGIRILIAFFVLFILNLNPIFQLSVVNSVFLSANKKILESDPINHSTKSSGIIISKINKGSQAFETLLDVLTFEIFGMLVSIITTIWLLTSKSLEIGLAASLMIMLIIVASTISTKFNSKIFKPGRITAEDKVSQYSTETLQQATYIRSVFGTHGQINLIQSSIKNYAGKEATGWEVDGTTYVMVRIIFFCSILVIAAMLLLKIQDKQISDTLALGLLSGYIYSLANIRTVGSLVKRLTDSHARIVDLFSFMQGFGKQTFPVLEESQRLDKEDQIL